MRLGVALLAAAVAVAAQPLGPFGGETRVLPVTGAAQEEAWNDPSVLVDADGTFHMWATHTATFPFGGPVQPYHLTSADGVSWSPVRGREPELEVGADEGAFDAHGVETPSVARFSRDGLYHMYYTAQASAAPTEWSIGHATSASPDGPWTKDAAGPVLSPSDLEGAFIVAEPGVVEWNATLFVFFTSVVASGEPAPNNVRYEIGVAESADGTNFENVRTAFTLAGSPFSFDDAYLGFSTPAPAVVRGALYVFHDVYRVGQNPACSAQDTTQAAVSYAYASSPAGPFNVSAGPLLERNDFAWTACEIRSGNAVVAAGTSEVALQFAGQFVSTDYSEIDYGVGVVRAALPNDASGGDGDDDVADGDDDVADGDGGDGDTDAHGDGDGGGGGDVDVDVDVDVDGDGEGGGDSNGDDDGGGGDESASNTARPTTHNFVVTTVVASMLLAHAAW